jgi:peptidyl-prolyl cis-trans isomerase A (cyclophilin A)
MLDYPGRDNAGYTVFGHVVDGMDTVEKIRMAATTVRAGMPNVPAAPIVIQAARLGK